MGVFKVSVFTPRQVEVLRVAKVHRKPSKTASETKGTPPLSRQDSVVEKGIKNIAHNEPADQSDDVIWEGSSPGLAIDDPTNKKGTSKTSGPATPTTSISNEASHSPQKGDLPHSSSSCTSRDTGMDSKSTADFEAVDIDVDMETVSKVRKGTEGKGDETFKVTYKVKRFVKGDTNDGTTNSPQVPPAPDSPSVLGTTLDNNSIGGTIRSDTDRPSMSGDALRKYQEEKRRRQEQTRAGGSSATTPPVTPPQMSSSRVSTDVNPVMGATAPWDEADPLELPHRASGSPATDTQPTELPADFLKLPTYGDDKGKKVAFPPVDEEADSSDEEEDEVLDVIHVEEELRLLLLDNIPGVRTIWNRCNSLRNVGENVEEDQVSFLEVTFYAKRKTALTMAQKILTEIGIGKDYGYIAVTECDFFRPIIDNSSRALLDRSDEEGDEGETVQSKEKRRRKQAFNDLNAQIEFDSVLAGVKDMAAPNFDFVAFLIIAAIIAALGLATNSTVSVVASMLVSPMMGPILATVMGSILFLNGNTTKAVHRTARSLLVTGFKVEFFCLGTCVVVGFITGLGFWGSDEAFGWGTLGTSEMSSRTSPTGLLIGMLIAIPSGGGVALSLLGNNGSGLVGVAISASLLPPAVNCGLYFAFALRNGEPSESIKKGLISLALTAVNVCAIYIAALVTFYIKRANPLGDMEGRSMDSLFGIDNFDEVAATAGAVHSQSTSMVGEDTGAAAEVSVEHSHAHKWNTTDTPLVSSLNRRHMRPARSVLDFQAMESVIGRPPVRPSHTRYLSNVPRSREALFNYRMNNDIPSSDEEMEPAFAPILSDLESSFRPHHPHANHQLRHSPTPPLSISRRGGRPAASHHSTKST